jgi:hypothetical protein
LIVALGVALAGAGLALADGPAPVPAPPSPPVPVAADPGPAKPVPPAPAGGVTLLAPEGAPQPTGAPLDHAGCQEKEPCSWARGEYLLWWIKNGRLPVLETNLDYGTFSGGRLAAGSWLNCDRTIGLEASGFLLEQRSTDLSAAATAVPITLPFVGTATASAALQSHTRLWGAEANGVFGLMRCNGYYADLLAGFRFLSLDENLNAQASASAAFMGVPVTALARANFQTQNHFYGGQVGWKGGGRWGRFSAELIGKVALGSMNEASNVTAAASAFAPGFSAAAGIVRRNTRDEFAILPEAQLRAGYDVTKNARLFVGYDILYVNEVLRPGDQTPVGRGAATFKGSDFWAQGVTFGLEMRF